MAVSTTPIEMKRPVNWWQIIGVLVAILTPLTVGLISMSNTVASQEVRIQKVETEQYNNQLKVEKEFDKLGNKIDDQGKDIRHKS
jgi:H+/gluconate symporter-like permease